MTKLPKTSPSSTRKPFYASAVMQGKDALDVKIEEYNQKFEDLGWLGVTEPLTSRVNKREDLGEEDKKLLLIDYLNVYLDFKTRNPKASDMDLVMDVHEKILEARTDFLTGVKNKQSFEEAFSFEQDYLKRLGSEKGRNSVPNSSLIIFDLNGFKDINDDLGHLAGDEALKHFSQIVSDTIRKTDGFYRTGGDEFSLILQGQDKEDAKAVIGKIRKALSEGPFQWEGQEIFLKTSAGVASIESEKHKAATLQEADDAMYADKKASKLGGGAPTGQGLQAPCM